MPNSRKTIRILGIDPGSLSTGYGVIDTTGNKHVHVAHGCIKTKKENDSLPQRLHVIFDGLSSVIEEYKPDEVGIEEVFLSKNAMSAIKLGQARGAAITAAVNKNLPVSEYAARLVKQALVGTGAADKTQVQHMVKVLLNLQGKLQADASDALAIAICHSHSR